MSSTVTSWSPDTNTKASETTSSALNNATLSGTLTVSGATQLNSTLSVGVNATGHDVKFFGASSGQYLLWDESADELVLAGDSKLSFHDAAGGENIIASGDGHLEINAGTTLDITAPTVDINVSSELNIDGNVDLNGTLDVSGTSTLTGLVTATNGVKLGNNILYASDGGATITLDTSDNVAIGNNLKVGGNIIQASDGGSTITMDTSDNVTIAGNLTAGLLVAKTYKPETFFAYNLASSGALSSGTEYYIPVGGNPFDFSTLTLQIHPTSPLVETALCDFTIERIAANIYTAEDNVTSVEIRLKKYDGSGNMDDNSQWTTVGTAATIHNSSTLNADTRVVQTPSDWSIAKNEVWGLTLEYTISSGTVANVQINGGILMLQDWSDIIANT